MPNDIARQPPPVADRVRSEVLHGASVFGLSPTEIDVQLSESTTVARVRTEDGDFALKIFDLRDVDESLTRWRHELAAHSASRGLPVPRPRATESGELTVRTSFDGRSVLMQASAWSPGIALADSSLDRELLREIGSTAARLSDVLQEARMPPAHEMHIWDLRRSGVTLTETLTTVSDAETRVLGLRALRAFHSIERTLADLPQAIVHQDLHDDNLRVGWDASQRSVVGILDFGDATYGLRIADLVIPAAYSSRHCADPLTAVDDVIDGWRAVLPLSAAERTTVLPLAAVRLATNAAVWQARSDGDRAEYADVRSRGSLAAASTLLDAIEG